MAQTISLPQLQQRATVVFRTLQRFDQIAGKAIGNADHVHMQGENYWSYALALGGKVFLAGLTIALVELMMAIIFSFGNSTWSFLASAGSGLLLLILAGWLYPGKVDFALGFIYGIGAIALAGAAAGLHGIDSNLTIRAIAPLLYGAVGILSGVHIATRIVGIIASVFTSEAYARRAPQLTLGKLRRLGLLTPEEDRQFHSVYHEEGRTIIVLYFIGIGAFFAGILSAFTNNISLALLLCLAAIGFLLLAYVMSLPGERRLQKLRQEVIARLKRENVLQLATKTVTYAVGWSLADQRYPVDASVIQTDYGTRSLGVTEPGAALISIPERLEPE